MTDYTLLPNESSFAVMMCMMSPERKRLPLTSTTDKPLREVNKKSNMLVFLLQHHEAAYMWHLVVVHYDTLHKIKQSTVASDAHWWFPSPPDALRLPGQVIISPISCSLSPALVVSEHSLVLPILCRINQKKLTSTMTRNVNILYLLFFLHVGQEVLRESFQSLLQLLGIVQLLIFTLKTHKNNSII